MRRCRRRCCRRRCNCSRCCPLPLPGFVSSSSFFVCRYFGTCICTRYLVRWLVRQLFSTCTLASTLGFQYLYDGFYVGFSVLVRRVFSTCTSASTLDFVRWLLRWPFTCTSPSKSRFWCLYVGFYVNILVHELFITVLLT